MTLTATIEVAGKRLDAFVAERAQGVSRSAAARLIAEGNVTVNGKAADKNDRLAAGDTVAITIPEAADTAVTAQEIPLDVVYEDEDVIVVNKPVGMVVHPAPGHPDGTLVNALLHHCKGQLSGINGVIRPGIVHRIDTDTSGLLILTNDGEFAHRVISPKSAVEKCYYAKVDGELNEEDVDAFREGLVLRDGTRCLPAKLELLEPGVCLVRVTEGKYHQVRRMLASRGKPVLELRRLSVGTLELDEGLGPGGWKELDEKDLCRLFSPDLMGNMSKNPTVF